MQLLYFVNNLLLLFNDTGPSGTFCNIPSEFAISINISIIVPINPRYQHNTAWQRAVVALSAMTDTVNNRRDSPTGSAKELAGELIEYD